MREHERRVREYGCALVRVAARGGKTGVLREGNSQKGKTKNHRR